MALAKITSKGQVTIPKSVRDSLRLYAGDKVEFIVTDTREAILKPVVKKVDDVFGMLRTSGIKPVSVEKMDATIRQKVRENFK